MAGVAEEAWEPLSRSRSNTWPALPRAPEEVILQPPAPAAAPSQRRSAPSRKPWGNLSYAQMIEQALSSAPGGRMTLAQIYKWLAAHVPYFGERSGRDAVSWKNSVRHNLSLRPRFTRQINESSSGRASPIGFWTIDPDAPQVRPKPRRAGSLDTSQQGVVAAAASARRRTRKARQEVATSPMRDPLASAGNSNAFRRRAFTMVAGGSCLPGLPVIPAELEPEDDAEAWQPYRSTLRVDAVPMQQDLNFRHLLETDHSFRPRSSSCVSSTMSHEEQANLHEVVNHLQMHGGQQPMGHHLFRPRSSSTTSSCISGQLSPAPAAPYPSPPWTSEAAPTAQSSATYYSFPPSVPSSEPSAPALMGSLEDLRDLQLDVCGSFGCDVEELVRRELAPDGGHGSVLTLDINPTLAVQSAQVNRETPQDAVNGYGGTWWSPGEQGWWPHPHEGW